MEKYIVEYFKKIEANAEAVRSDEYKQWIYENIKRSMDDSEFLYEETNPNYENSRLFSSFYTYVESKYDEINPMIPFQEARGNDAENIYFPSSLLLNFRIKDCFYSICTIWGQGSMTTIKKLNGIPSHYIVLSEQ